MNCRFSDDMVLTYQGRISRGKIEKCQKTIPEDKIVEKTQR